MTDRTCPILTTTTTDIDLRTMGKRATGDVWLQRMAVAILCLNLILAGYIVRIWMGH